MLKGSVDFTPVEPSKNLSVAVRLVEVSTSTPIVLSEQTIAAKGNPPVPFEINYRAEDIEPPKRAQLEVRVSVDGRLKYYNVNAYPVSLANAGETVQVWVVPIRS